MTEATIRKKTGAFESPRARMAADVRLYRKTAGMPRNMISI